MKATRKYENEAKEFCNAIRKLAEDNEALDNFEMYLSLQFDIWLKKWGNTPENITAELVNFANIYSFTDTL